MCACFLRLEKPQAEVKCIYTSERYFPSLGVYGLVVWYSQPWKTNLQPWRTHQLNCIAKPPRRKQPVLDVINLMHQTDCPARPLEASPGNGEEEPNQCLGIIILGLNARLTLHNNPLPPCDKQRKRVSDPIQTPTSHQKTPRHGQLQPTTREAAL